MTDAPWENATRHPWADVAGQFPVLERHRFSGLPVIELDGGLLVVRAVTPEVRRRALRGLEKLDPRHALQVPTGLFEHTRGMQFTLDLVWLDADENVLRTDRDVIRGRLRACAQARSVVETVAGQAGAFLAAGLGCRPHAGGAPPPDQGWLPAGNTWQRAYRVWR